MVNNANRLEQLNLNKALKQAHYIIESTDPLTGLPNIRYSDRTIVNMLEALLFDNKGKPQKGADVDEIRMILKARRSDYNSKDIE